MILPGMSSSAGDSSNSSLVKNLFARFGLQSSLKVYIDLYDDNYPSISLHLLCKCLHMYDLDSW
jgi:hypothetical protein